MDSSIGIEVGQKMRSAVRAKLMELGCYVDDELPDYIMVMVANKRTRKQMIDDLHLFLRAHTETFVEWLQQVLKKLKSVTISNPSVNEFKRKASIEIAECVVKKERKIEMETECHSITDEIPVQATKLFEKRKSVKKEEKMAPGTTIRIREDSFDIPSLAEVHELVEDSELDLVESRIKEVRNRIVMMVSDSEEEQEEGADRVQMDEDEDCLNIGADTEELRTELDATAINQEENQPKSDNKEKNRKVQQMLNLNKNVRRTIRLSESLREELEISGRLRSKVQNIPKPLLPTVENTTCNKRKSVHKRLGVRSSVVSLPKRKMKKMIDDDDDGPSLKSVMSVVKVKPSPRTTVLPTQRKSNTDSCRATRMLLLKAMADAQKSIVQASSSSSTTTKVNTINEKDALYSKKYLEIHNLKSSKDSVSSSSECGSSKIKNLVIELKEKDKNESNEYIPSPVKTTTTTKVPEENSELEYQPSTIDLLNYDEEDLDEYMNEMEEDESKVEPKLKLKQQFIITLDGIKDSLENDLEEGGEEEEKVVEEEEKRPIRKVPSPIVFEKSASDGAACKLTTLKTLERCKYWPECQLANGACKFVHPNGPCKMFPFCKFGDRCLYVHPKCKFDASCTRKDCPYSHAGSKLVQKLIPKPSKNECRFYPNCSNVQHCHFYHPPKPCRFGKFCLNKHECNYLHYSNHIPDKNKLTWHSNH